MKNFEIIIIILTVLIALLALADKFRLPSPVLLVVAGLCIGFLPSMPLITLNPDVIFFLFLPPLLYDASSHTSWHDFKAEIKPISMLAIALVLFTTVGVAVASHELIPGFTWPLAFVLGAIVSPPDAIAATTITKGLGLNKRVITILEGESLVNDASALIAYRFAIAAIGTGSFIFWEASLNFLLVVLGGIIVGMLIGYLFIIIHKKVFNNSIISTSLTLLTPFISYLTAEHLHCSGVLAVVGTGLMMSWRASDIFSYQTRIRSKAVWDTLIFLLNGFIFILIGLQLPSILNDLTAYSIKQLLFYGIVVSAVTIFVRILWVFMAAASSLSSQNKNHGSGEDNTWKSALIVAWTGTRGVVSLATALALPLTLTNGLPFPHRSLILFLAFVVIFVTLVIQGMSLPMLIRILGIKQHKHPAVQERELRLSMAASVLHFIEHDFPYDLNTEIKTQLKKQYTEMIETTLEDQPQSNPSEFFKAQFTINQFERKLLRKYHRDGTFNQSTTRRIEQELDQEELQFNHKKHKKRK